MVKTPETKHAAEGARLTPETTDATIGAISLEQALADAAVANARVVDLTHRLIDITREAHGLRMQLQQAHAPLGETDELAAQLYHARIENESLHARLRQSLSASDAVPRA